ncbi:hypothetical protein [Flavobacterium sp.]|jgi:hypothetical protein|uniref:hypothetical protein n=1 Tax=Flavobacterium sp. TaxID=239 RepID=UPI002A80E276|nr:hypothetical protein [Flavobacterium sp.]
MKKKTALLNFVLMLSVLFAVSYQSMHVFLHHKHDVESISSSEKTFTKNLTEKENCPTCDFKFASFLSPVVFTFSFFPPHFEIPYLFAKKENFNSFCGSLFSQRGPPGLV